MGLKGEKIAWTQKKSQFTEQFGFLVGDILVCSGVIAYLGAFTLGLRDETVD